MAEASRDPRKEIRDPFRARITGDDGDRASSIPIAAVLNAAPSFWLLGGFIAANVVAAGIGHQLKLIPGVDIILWLPAGLFVAALLLNYPSTWPWWIAAAGVAELIGNFLWFHNPLPVALVYFVANAAVAVLAAVLVRWALADRSPRLNPQLLESPANIARFIVVAGGIAPMAGATLIGATDAVLGKHEFWDTWRLVWLGDGTGVIVAAPLALAAVQVWRQRDRLVKRRVAEFAGTCFLTALLAWLALRGHLPTVYLAIPALVWMAVRFQFPGAGAALATVLFVVAVSTRAGYGEFAGKPEEMQPRIMGLQVFLGVCASTALMVAGLSVQHAKALSRLNARNRSLARRVERRTAALRESEERGRLAVKAAQVGIFNYDPVTHRQTFCDEAMRIWGFAPGTDPSPDLVLETVYPEDRAAVKAAADASLDPEGNGQLVVEHRILRADGSTRWVAASARTMFERRNGYRKAIRCFGTMLDITDRKRAEQAFRESEERFRAMADGLPLLVWVHDADGRLVFVNKTYCEFFGVARERMRDDEWQVLLHPDDAPAYTGEWASCVREQRFFHAELRVQDRQGRWRWLESWAQPRRAASGEFVGFLGTSADITDRKEAEAALRDADRRKNEFLATLAHELRNPLATVRSGLEIIKLKPDDPALVAETRATMDRQLTHLVVLVDDLLEVSRISQGKLKLREEVVSVAEVIHSAVETCRPLLEEAGHDLRLDLPEREVHVQGDFHRLSQLFGNLINNSVKYTPPGGRIVVAAEVQREEVVVGIEDSGIGIPPDQLANVFEMYGQVERGQSFGSRGLGIGLALVKTLVELHGGSIAAASAGEGSGAQFTVRLPTVDGQPPLRVAAPVKAEPKPVASRRVLVVDDNAAAAKTLAIVVKMLGNEVVVASNGQEGLEKGREFAPEIVIMDLGMPIMDGYEAARLMRREAWGKDVILIALSGWGQDDDKQKSKDAGFDSHLVKPADVETIRQVFAQLSESHRS